MSAHCCKLSSWHSRRSRLYHKRSARPLRVRPVAQGVFEPKKIHVNLPTGETRVWRITTPNDLSDLLDARGLRGASLADKDGTEFVGTVTLEDGEEYMVLAPPGAPKFNVTFQVQQKDGSFEEFNYLEVSQRTLTQFMTTHGLVGFTVGVGASQTKNLIESIAYIQTGGFYIGVPTKSPGLSVRVVNLEAEQKNVTSGLEDAGATAVVRVAERDHPTGSITRLPHKLFKDKTGKKSVIELDGGAVVDTGKQRVLYVMEHKRSLRTSAVLAAKELPNRLKSAALQSPELATVLDRVNSARVFVCTENIQGASLEEQDEVLEVAQALGVSVLTLNGTQYDLTRDARQHYAL